ncbi:hypothetical protein J8F10_36310 [Gemmata sp. G18]|uniref:Uncharacterized protein n=1 Tax=Gemmata palustris TaxID=2822762 RepID=A0ABS5C404_9BACT|nr:hypothetical protein [Gemmata palustris]MBP3960719.1 hypothetical protein [Gemmata palustris]
MNIRTALGLVALGTLATASLAGEPKETKLKPTLVLRGSHSAIRKERFVVVTQEREWKELWAQHRGKEADPPFTERDQELSPDFDIHFVVAVFVGCDASLSVETFMRGDEVLLHVSARGYQTEGRLPGQVDGLSKRTAHQEAKDEAVADYCFIVLPKPLKTVVVETDVRRQLDLPPQWKEQVRFHVPQDKK